jgi:hypothetical protein
MFDKLHGSIVFEALPHHTISRELELSLITELKVSCLSKGAEERK